MSHSMTENERQFLAAIRQRLDRLRPFLTEQAMPEEDTAISEWYDYLAAIKEIVGNANNDLSFIACLMAKDYLNQRLAMAPFDAALKPQGAPGMDIDERTVDGERVVGEIKTTSPYLGSELGAAQKTTFAKDFDELVAATADHRFFFVTEPATYGVVMRRYASRLPGIQVVLLPGDQPNTPAPDSAVRQDELARG